MPLPSTPYIPAMYRRDYENGCFGCGETEELLIGILERHMKDLGTT